MRKGLPQRSALAPPLFRFYISWVAEVVPKGADVLMSADVVTVLTQHQQKQQAVSLLQTSVDKVATWSKGKKMQLRRTKSEVTFFSSDNSEAAWTPSITLNK